MTQEQERASGPDPAAPPAAVPEAPPRRGLAERFRTAAALEFGQFRWRIFLVGLLARLLPTSTCGGARATLLRWMGFSIGPGTAVLGLPSLTGGVRRLAPNLVVGAACTLEWGCVLELGEKITLGDRVALAPEVLIITTSHELGPKTQRAGPALSRPVSIGAGTTIGARAIILPGVTIGEGAQVLAGSVVNRDVAPRTRAGGVPAKPLGPADAT